MSSAELSAAADLTVQARAVWPEAETVERMPITLGVVAGNISRQVRALGDDNIQLDGADMARLLAQVALMALRYIDDLGQDVDTAIAAAMASQRAYREERGMP